MKKVVPDPDRDSCVLVMLEPAAHIDRLDEVLVITALASRFSDQQQQDVSASEILKQADLTTLAEQKKASEIMAERLPGLKDPNQPAAPAQPNGAAVPTPAATPIGPTHPQPALHPDRFTPAGAMNFSRPPAASPGPAQSGPAQSGAARPAATGAKPPVANGQKPAVKPQGAAARPATAQGRNQE